MIPKSRSVHLPLSAKEWRLQPNFQKGRGGLTGPQLLVGGSWERGDDFFQGGLQFLHKK